MPQKPEKQEPRCPTCGSDLAKSPAGEQVLHKVSQAMAKKTKGGGPTRPGGGQGMPQGQPGQPGQPGQGQMNPQMLKQMLMQKMMQARQGGR